MAITQDTICLVGVFASLHACIVGLLPPRQLGHANTLMYVSAMLGGVLVIGVLQPAPALRVRGPGWKASARGRDEKAPD